MCGILGYWDRRQQALSDDALHAMAQALELMSDHDLDVRLVSYGPPSPALRALVR